MQSEQETVLEEFMQRSFGAQFLYVPKKYLKGSSPREPADLAWVVDNYVVLFYLRSSAEALSAQIEHNRKQAKGYLRHWSSGKTAYALRGKNRFGDECFVSYQKLRSHLTILVVSNQCGVHVATPLTNDSPSAVIVIPELLVHWVANFGGTIVDLLHIIHVFLGMPLVADMPPEASFPMLASLVDTYVEDAFSKADPNKHYLSGSLRKDFVIIWEHLSRMRVPAITGSAFQDAKSRERASALFGDLMLVEYASLVATSETAIDASEPPKFKKSVLLKIDGLYYKFVIATVHLGSNNVPNVTNAAIEACKNEAGEIDSIYVLYGNVMDTNEYRSPLMFGLPPKLPKKHSTVLVEKIIEKARSDVKNRI